MRTTKTLYLLMICAAVILLWDFDALGQGKVTKESFGKTADGQAVELFTLVNKRGAEAKITN